MLHTQVECAVSGVMLIGLLLAYLKEAKECQIDLLDMHLVPSALNACLLSAVMTSFKYSKTQQTANEGMPNVTTISETVYSIYLAPIIMFLFELK